MKTFLRYTGTIAVTAIVALVAAAALLGTPRVDAQPAPAPSVAGTPTASAGSAVVPAAPAAGSAAPAAGSAAPAAGSAAPAAGSAAPAAGSAAPAADSAAPAAGSAAPAPAAPAAPAGSAAVVEVPCSSGTPATTINGVTDGDVTVETIVKFVMPAGSDATPDNDKSAGLEIKGGQTKCLKFSRDGVFLFHAGARHAAINAHYWYDLLVNKEIDDLKGGNFWMPKAVNLPADSSDLMYYAVLGLSIFFFTAIAVAVVYLVIKYRHRPGHKAEPSAAHNDALEVTWTVIPTIICVFLFYFGWRTYVHVVTPPVKAVEVNVLAWRWNWQFTHSNGVQDSDLHVPVNTPVRLVMTSKDVLHSFYAPVMRVKQDIIPRRYTYAWFQATKPGTYRLACAEYCGTNHSQMGITEGGRRAVVVVHEPGGYERYLADKAAGSKTGTPAERGAKLYEKKGCNACHTLDGTPRVGPSFAKTFGTMVPLADGSQVKMDENYITESLLYPQAKARPGMPPSMPSFQGQLKDKEINDLIEFIKSLK